jgi:nucleoside-diphosphate-sugar epimerase
MNVLIIGGTGLLGSAAAEVLIARGHTVRAMALPPLPQGAPLPPAMALTFGNYTEMTDGELTAALQGLDGLLFAAGVDERVEGPAPIEAFYRKHNITPLERLLRLAKANGVRHAVICGSYFSYFDKLWPEMELSKWHPYIRSRREQERMALSFADDAFSVSVLELPYIFGTQPGRKPVWVFLIELIRRMKLVTLYSKGGTAMITVRQAAQAMAGALERGQGGACYPLGFENLTWVQFLRIVHRYMGYKHRGIITVPRWAVALGARGLNRKREVNGGEGGLNAVKYAALQSKYLFIGRELGCEPLGVEADDLDAAIGQSVRLSLAVLDGKTTTLDMKAE